MKILVVVDVQNDFVTGTLGKPTSQAVVPRIVQRVEEGLQSGETVIFTRDTHGENYGATREEQAQPIVHCVEGTEGWEIVEELKGFAAKCLVVDKPTFGSVRLAEILQDLNRQDQVESVTLIGLVTDVCVFANAILARTVLTEAEVYVDASCCAGVTPERHKTALNAMKCCQIKIENE